jgi:hypothetical protein
MSCEASAELAGTLIPSFNPDGRYKLVHSVGLWVLSRTRKRINSDPEAGTNRLDKIIGFHGPSFSSPTSTKLIDIRPT